MKELLGAIIIASGIVLGLWVGFWVMFVGGIIQVVNNVTPIANGLGIALGLLRIVCSGAVGWLSVLLVGGIGAALIK